ncbi:MAG: cysteine desulfurase NifS [Nitrospirota bacterium]
MKVYLDNNATTQLIPEVLDAMLPYLKEKYGNASSLYSLAHESKKALEESRQTIATVLGASSKECICFTGSGSEADNMALQGVAGMYSSKGKHIITSEIEHHAVLNTCKHLEEIGFEVAYVKPDGTGLISADAVSKELRKDTILVSIMHANNEVGTINPIAEISKVVKSRGILFHTDAVQSFCKLPYMVDSLGVDLLSLSAHKIHGPKGVGVLYIREGVQLKPLIYGGHQEFGRRAGTENIAGIRGLAKAAEIASRTLDASSKKIKFLRDKLERTILKKIPEVRVNGNSMHRLPNTLNVSFPFIEAESLILDLDMKGVALSSGSACSSGSGDPSHVLVSMGIDHATCRGSLRFSLGENTTEEEINYVIDILPPIVERIRSMSPLS